MPPKAIFILLAILIFAPTKFAWANWIWPSWNEWVDLGFRILYAIATFILGSLVVVTKWIFDMALSLSMKEELYDIAEVGWGVSLAMANNFFILILLAIAIATILGLSQFNYKKMLPPFLMVLLLINFSMVIGKVIIDVTNLFAYSFSEKIFGSAQLDSSGKKLGGSGEIAAKIGASKPGEVMGEKVEKFAKDPSFMNHVIDMSVAFGYQIFIYLLLIFIYLAGAVYMLTRTFWLLLLLMLAPLAWIALLIPSLKKHWTTWWDKFIKWCLFAPAYLFFLMLGLQVGSAVFNSEILKNLGSFQDIAIVNIFGALLVGFILIMGTFVSSALGVGGSNFVMNYANKMKGAASKKFNDLRAKTPLSAEKLGAKFGALGAGVLAKSRIGAVAGYGKETRERLELERAEENIKKESIKELRRDLKKQGAPGYFEKRRMKKGGFTIDQIREYETMMKIERLETLRKIRAKSGSGKVDFEKELKKLLERSGGGEAKEGLKKEEVKK